MTFSYFEILIKIVKSFKPINFIICTVFNFLQNLMHSLKRISKLELLAIFLFKSFRSSIVSEKLSLVYIMSNKYQ
ncbi:hypothetical protein BGAPBR_E0051 (plasmid) [Borreliella garinii PBr]|uniref:Uncharacterized protein n=1 Tax=Borreliella garinii PBr TaxID=498743 RepID=B8F0N1_BORGR|nr:hypothetical protein BGAPBR_E0051 [Borreliella garinii PBr]